MNKRITVIIPAYNEADRIAETLEAVSSLSLINEIIVVDDGSTDLTGEAAKAYPEVKLLIHPQNRGKAAALETGMKEALKTGEIIAFLDADLGESSRELEKLILPIIEEKAEVTIACFPASQKKGGFGLVKGLVYWGQLLHTGKSISSALSGQRVMTREMGERLSFSQRGYGVEMGMTIDLLKANARLMEVPVNMSHRETGRDLSGFIHRGRQFRDILLTLFYRKLQMMRR